jgi:hypothetical protein
VNSSKMKAPTKAAGRQESKVDVEPQIDVIFVVVQSQRVCD